jgi:hypothetical protein
MSFPVGNKYTPQTTPLHVSQLIHLYLKETFKSIPDNHPFQHKDDFDLTGVIFDTVYNKESKIYGSKPIVIVSSGDFAYGNLALGDRAATHEPSMNYRQTSIVQSSVIIKVIGDHYGSIGIIGNEVFNMLITARTLLPNITSIHQVQGIQASQIATFEEGDHMYYQQIILSYAMQYKWVHLVPQNVLNSIALNMDSSGAVDNRDSIVQ